MPAHTFRSYAAVGDSFTEGVGDDLPDGSVRGWADLVALGLALATPDAPSPTPTSPSADASSPPSSATSSTPASP